MHDAHICQQKNNALSAFFLSEVLLNNISPCDSYVYKNIPIGNINAVIGETVLTDSESYFAAALRYFLDNKPRKNLTQQEVAERVGVTQSSIGRLSKGRFHGKESLRRKIAAVYGFDGSGPGRLYDDFLAFGQELLDGPPEPERPKEENNRLKIITLEHKNLIDGFQNKPAAYELNKKLIEIERLDPEKFDEIQEYIEMIHRRISSKKIAGNDSE